MSLNIQHVRQQFPILHSKVGSNPLVYLDSAATTHMPKCVSKMMEEFEETSRANVHRGMHTLADAATMLYESARNTVADFVHAKHAQEIVFTKNCTEALNIAIQCWGRSHLKKGDTVAISILEHHSNIVPWQMLQQEIGIEIIWLDTEEDGTIALSTVKNLLEKNSVKAFSITGLSNVTGYAPPLKEIIELTHAAGAIAIVDAAQYSAHIPIDVQDLDCDFLAFSGHKIYGPTGIGALYGKRKHLETIPPLLGGGMMIHEVTKTGFLPAEIPHKFEAGTPPIAQAIGLMEAIQWAAQFTWDERMEHDKELYDYSFEQLSEIHGTTVFGYNSQSPIPNPQSPTGCMSFTIEGIHPHDLTHILGEQGIALRAGHHCCQPWHDQMGINSTARVSFGIYNTKEEIDALIEGIHKVTKRLS